MPNILLIVTLDNRVIKFNTVDNSIQQADTVLKLTVNCMGLNMVSRGQSFPLFVGVGNSNQLSTGDTKATLYFYAPQPKVDHSVTLIKPSASILSSTNIFDLQFAIDKKLLNYSLLL
jgi:hypothetical protein